MKNMIKQSSNNKQVTENVIKHEADHATNEGSESVIDEIYAVELSDVMINLTNSVVNR